MKMLVFSDVHRNKKRLEAILKHHEDVEYRISLGDSELKSSFLEQEDIIAIKGNYPFDSGFTYEHVMPVEKYKILLVHGHKYKVQNGLEKLYFRALEAEVDIAFYGHTHIAALDRVDQKLLINPGSVNKSRNHVPESYMIVEFRDDGVHFVWYNAHNHEILKASQL